MILIVKTVSQGSCAKLGTSPTVSRASVIDPATADPHAHCTNGDRLTDAPARSSGGRCAGPSVRSESTWQLSTQAPA